MHHRVGSWAGLASCVVLGVSCVLALGAGCGAAVTAEAPTHAARSTPPAQRGAMTAGTAGARTQSCVSGSVYFGVDSAQLDEASRQQLMCIARGSERVSLVGMTDPRGTEEYNLALGERRARMVAEHLGRVGYDSARIETRSLGEEVATGKGEPEWAHDRRVSFAAQ